MKKIRFISILIALLALVLVVTPALAWDEKDVSVVASPITVDGSHTQGYTAEASGTVTITASASSDFWIQLGWLKIPMYDYASASSEAGFTINAPSGDLAYSGDSGLISDSEQGWGNSKPNPPNADADASQTFEWSQVMVLNDVGEYILNQYGDATASTGYWLLWKHMNTESASGSSFATWTVVRDDFLTLGASYHHPAEGMSGFCVDINNKYQVSAWKDSCNSHTTTSEINITGGGVTVNVPAGTVVNENGCLVGYLGIKTVGTFQGEITYVPGSVTFSNPVTLTDKAGNVIAKFTEIKNGTPVE